jgi:N-methylhydantoinase A
VTHEASLERTPIRIPVIDINAIGAGGGSIAWIDEGGALRVGPMSAEAVPGPACYSRGGTKPTVTDANLVLGRFGGDTRLGGELTLDKDVAERAIDAHIAGPLGLDLVTAAAGILRVANANMVRGIRVVSIERGHDPRGLTLVPFGGAGPMHGSPVARELSIPRLLVPPDPGILCALGLLVADLRHDLSQTLLAAHADFSAADARASFQPMLAEARYLLAGDRVAPERREIEMRVDMRYIGQSFELPIPVTRFSQGKWAALAPAFHAEHERRFGHSDPSAPVEIVSLGVTARGVIDTPELPRPEKGGATPPAATRSGVRHVYFEAGGGGGWYDCTVWARDGLLAGNEIAGPAIVEEVSATTVLYPGDRGRIDEFGSLVVEIGP